MTDEARERVVVVGAGHAGVAFAAALAGSAWEGRITLVDASGELPYQRPPLSKELLATGDREHLMPLRAASFYDGDRVELRSGRTVVGIDRAAGSVAIDDGTVLGYDHLVLAGGGRARRLALPGADAPGVVGLRTDRDAEALVAHLQTARRVLVVGAGFIGLEAAFSARGRGAEVVVYDIAPLPLSRVASPELARFVRDRMAAAGIELRPAQGLEAIVVEDGRAAGLRFETEGGGELVRGDLVVTGIGIEPHDALAAAAGLETSNGIVVDDALRTADPRVWAIGDCAVHPNRYAGRSMRLESVQNATDQGKHVAALLAAGPGARSRPYDAVPWFWSHFGEDVLDIAGVAGPQDAAVLRGDPATGSFSVYRYAQERVTAVESVNSRREHLAARRLLAGDRHPRRELVADPDFDLRAFLA